MLSQHEEDILHHNFDERRSILIQDIRDLTTYIFPKLVNIHNELVRRNMVHVNVTEMFFWMLCELTVKQYAYQVRSHNSKDNKYRIPYDQIRNAWNAENISLEQIFEFYVKGPALYVPSHDVQVSLSPDGTDVIFTFFWNEIDYLRMKQRLSK